MALAPAILRPSHAELIDRCLRDPDFAADASTGRDIPALAAVTLQRAYEDWCFDARVECRETIVAPFVLSALEVAAWEMAEAPVVDDPVFDRHCQRNDFNRKWEV